MILFLSFWAHKNSQLWGANQTKYKIPCKISIIEKYKYYTKKNKKRIYFPCFSPTAYQPSSLSIGYASLRILYLNNYWNILYKLMNKQEKNSPRELDWISMWDGGSNLKSYEDFVNYPQNYWFDDHFLWNKVKFSQIQKNYK